MVFILSSVTNVIFGTTVKTRGIISVQINAVPQIQRLPVLGSVDPFAEVIQLQNQVSLTRYGGGPTYNVVASTSCIDANTIKFSFVAGACTPVAGLNLNGDFFVNSYSFSKEVNQFGQESWGLIDKSVLTFSSGASFGSQNKVLVRGISQGKTTPSINTGVTLSPIGLSTGLSTSITAGNPGVGKANIINIGVVTKIGNSITSNGSEDGTGEASIPYTEIQL